MDFCVTIKSIYSSVNSYIYDEYELFFSFFFLFFFPLSFFLQTQTQAVTFLTILILWQCGVTLFQQFLTNPNTTESSYLPLMMMPPWVMFRWVFWFGLAGAFGEAMTPENWTVIGGGVLPRMVGYVFLNVSLSLCLFVSSPLN